MLNLTHAKFAPLFAMVHVAWCQINDKGYIANIETCDEDVLDPGLYCMLGCHAYSKQQVLQIQILQIYTVPLLFALCWPTTS